MLFVLEGCDGTGKTTAAKKLAEVFNAEIIHCTAQTPNTYEYFKKIVLEADKRNIVADRFCYGQFVYQNPSERPMDCTVLPSGEGLSSYEALWRLEELMKRHGTLLILVTAKTEEIEKRLEERGEKLINGMTVDYVKREFQQLFDTSMLKYITIDTTTEGGERK